MTEMKHDKFARMKYKNGESLFVNTEYITAYGFIKEQNQTVITVLGEGKEIYFPGDQTNKLLKEQQPKTGHWIIVEYETLTCSCCGKSYYTGCDSTKEATANLEKGNVYRYCPYCGAKMEKQP